MFSVLSRWPGGPPWESKSPKVLRPAGLEQSESGREMRCGRRGVEAHCVRLTGHYKSFGSSFEWCEPCDGLN